MRENANIMAATTSEGERIHQVEMNLSELRGAYQHLATKADLAETRAELKADIAEIRGELRLMKWFMGLTLAAVVYPLLERIWT